MVDNKKTGTALLTLLLVIALLITAGVSFTAWLKFREITFENQGQAKTHTIIEGLLIGEAVLALVGAMIAAGIAMFGKGPKHYGWILAILLFSLIGATAINISIYFLWRQLTVEDKSTDAYKFMSNFVFLAPFIYTVFVFLVLLVRCWAAPAHPCVAEHVQQQQKIAEHKKLSKQERAIKKRKEELGSGGEEPRYTSFPKLKKA